ncbi:MAG: EF-hand domain-containing protein [Rhodobacteraceae bacterium]|nr:EF-hand domain-containing protein [Paracoccaceae bacterium]
MKKIILTLTATLALTTSAFAQGAPGWGFLNNWDFNEDGQVTLEEATERRGDIFLTFDDNEDGILNADEYAGFDNARAIDQEGKTPPINTGRQGATGMTLEFNDIDGDGQISREEFISRTAAWIALLDSNADGVVTSADFVRP